MSDYFIYDNATQFKNYLKLLNQYFDELYLTMDQEGIKIRQMDPSRVSMIIFEMPKWIFREYSCEQERKIAIALDSLIGSGKKPFRKTEKDESVKFEFKDLEYQVTLMKQLKRTWTLPLLDDEFDEPPEPKLPESEAIITLTVDSLNKIIDDLVEYESLTIITEPDQIKFIQQTDTQIYGVPIRIGDEPLLKLETNNLTKASYKVNYLKPFINSLKPISSIITLQYSENMPIILTAHPPEETTLKIYVAPCINTE